MASKSPLKLNLGCGYDHRKGWVNVDIDPIVKPDLLHDITQPLPYKTHTISEILAQDVLEHLTLEQARTFLNDCYRVLKPTGVLTVRVPNVEAIYTKFKFQPDIMMHFLYGNTSKNGVWGAHKYGYTPKIMQLTAWEHGFKVISFDQEDTNWKFELQLSAEPLEIRFLGKEAFNTLQLKKYLPWKTGATFISSNPFLLLFNHWFVDPHFATVWLIELNFPIFLLKPFKRFLWSFDLVIVPTKNILSKTQNQLHISHLKIKQV